MLLYWIDDPAVLGVLLRGEPATGGSSHGGQYSAVSGITFSVPVLPPRTGTGKPGFGGSGFRSAASICPACTPNSARA